MRTLAALALSLVLTSPLAAQNAPRTPRGAELVDAVVAVVGDTALLLSDVQAELQQLAAAGRLPNDPAQQDIIARDLVESRVNDLLLLQAAKAAGTEVRDEQVDETVEQSMRSVRRQFRTEAEFVNALASSGLTVEQYRQQLREQQRAQLMIQQFVGTRLRNRARPLVSEDQIRRAFETQRANLGTRPATVSLQQVIVAPQPSDSARAAARRQAEEVLRELEGGADFQVLARRFSADSASREHGGDLGWFKRGVMVPAFEEMAFSLRPGMISPLVETEFGFHIIKVEKARGPERQARHILISPEITPADEQRARERADSVAQAMRAGANPLVLARQYKTPEQEMEVTRFPVDRLLPAYEAALRDATTGQVVGPVELVSPRGSRWAVLKLTGRTEAGEYTLDDLREQIRTRLQEQELIEQLVEELRNEIYVAVLR